MGRSAPEADPAMGEAAKLSAQTGERMLDFMQSQSEITNRWATDDRARSQTVFQPFEDQYIADAQSAMDPTRIGANADQRASEARADVRQQFGLQREADRRQVRAMGVLPNSGRNAALRTSRGSAEALAAAAASNLARRQSVQQDEARGEAMRSNAINSGKGLAVNPAQSMGLSNGAAQAGFSGAQAGYGQQADILNMDYKNRFNAWEANQGMLSGLAGGLGQIAGASNIFPALGMLSSKDAKTDKRPAPEALGAIRKMPVEKWRYKDGLGDGGQHIGPYAEGFQEATGIGDGKSIDVQSMMGVTLAAVKEMDKRVSKLTPMGVDRKQGELA